MKLSVSVIKLAAFVWQRGDINRWLDEATSPQEGVNTQKKYQSQRRKVAGSYETEVNYKRQYQYRDFELTVSGRIDGLILHHSRRVGNSATIEEIKTTRHDIDAKRHQDGSVHDAQVKLYAALVCAKENVPICTTKVVYVHPDTMKTDEFREQHSMKGLDQFFIETCNVFLDWQEQMRDRLSERNRLAKLQEFPFASYLDDQHRLATEVYRGIRATANVMLTAPTGSGKSMTVSFPTVKGMGEDLVDRMVFVTARTTGQDAGMDALAELGKQNSSLTYANIIAKERICFTEGMPCEPDACEFAKGHFDRVRDATVVLLKRRQMDRKTIESVARCAKVCPFELSLDAAEWADAVVCDYNYVFDPFVALMRLQTNMFSKNVLIVDEAHRLSDRVKEMLGCTLSVSVLRQALKVARDRYLVVRIHALMEFVSSLEIPALDVGMEIEVSFDLEKFWFMLLDVQEASNRPQNRLTKEREELRELEFVVFQFLNARDRYVNQDYFWLLRNIDEELVLELKCIDASSWIAEKTGEYKASIRASATLSPPSLYDDAHGIEGTLVESQATSLHRNFAVFVVPDLSTYYQDRTRTVADIAKLISQLRMTTVGNWLVALPSFEYLTLLSGEFSDTSFIRLQQQEMNLDDRQTLLDWINEPGQRLAMVVMGGVFTESVDYNTNALTGVIVVGPAIPPRSVELEKTRTALPNGFEMAYRLPAMARVVQSVGRVVRGATDRGVGILIDPRFTQKEHARYFPAHWRPKVVRSGDLHDEVERFWKDTAVS